MAVAAGRCRDLILAEELCCGAVLREVTVAPATAFSRQWPAGAADLAEIAALKVMRFAKLKAERDILKKPRPYLAREAT